LHEELDRERDQRSKERTQEREALHKELADEKERLHKELAGERQQLKQELEDEAKAQKTAQQKPAEDNQASKSEGTGPKAAELFSMLAGEPSQGQHKESAQDSEEQREQQREEQREHSEKERLHEELEGERGRLHQELAGEKERLHKELAGEREELKQELEGEKKAWHMAESKKQGVKDPASKSKGTAPKVIELSVAAVPAVSMCVSGMAVGFMLATGALVLQRRRRLQGQQAEGYRHLLDPEAQVQQVM